MAQFMNIMTGISVLPTETVDKVNVMDTKMKELETKVNKKLVNQSSTAPTEKDGLWIDTSK